MAQQDINIQKRWQKMLSNSISRNKIPAEYLSISKNARIKDLTITKRLGQKTRKEWTAIVGETQGITYNKKLLMVMWGHLYSVDETTYTETDIGSVWTTAPVNFINYGIYTIILTGIGKPYIYDGNSLFQMWPTSYLPAYLTSWDAPTIVIATWQAVTDWSFSMTIDWTLRTVSGLNFSTDTTMAMIASRIQIAIRALTTKTETVVFNAANRFVISSSIHTSTSAITVTSATGSGTDISGAWATAFLDCETGRGTVTDKALLNNCPDVNPIMWVSFAWFTMIVGNTADTNNILYISRPIIGTEQRRAFDWTGTDAEKITLDKEILGVKSTMNKVFMFTENRVEYIGKDSLQTIGWTASLISTPIGDWWPVASNNWISAAADKIFYLTKNNTINTLWYAEGTVEPEIAILTDQVAFTITKYLDNLDPDQSNCRVFYDDENKQIEWELRTNEASYNDTSLVYDLGNQTRTTFTNRLFNGVVKAGSKLYAGSSINNSLIELNVGLDDDDTPIEWEIQDSDIMLWTLREKMFQGWQTSGGLNISTNLEFRTLIDDGVASLNYVKGIDYIEISDETWEIGGGEIWWDAIGGTLNNTQEEYTQFDKTLDHGYIYKRGTRIKRNIKENSLGSNFYLDYFTLFADVTWNIDLSDKR